MLVAKQVADLSTGVRALLAFLFAWTGWAQGASGLVSAVWMLLAAWTSDILDGPIARRSNVSQQTWIGEHDLEIDILVSLGLLVYMLEAGFLSGTVTAFYLLAWGLVFWRWGLQRSLGMLMQAPVYGWFIWLALKNAPLAGWTLVGWILAAMAISWPRFPQEVVPGFLSGMREAWDLARRDRD